MGARGKGRGRGRGATTKNPPVTSKKRGKSSAADAEEPPAKLKKEESMNTKLRRAIQEKKDTAEKKMVFKPDATLVNLYSGKSISIHEDFSCMLNQTNIGQNNNKYYVIQLANCAGMYVCFTKWGRVGEPGQSNNELYMDAEGAIKTFKAKFKSKTKNNWDDRDNFKPQTGKYTLLEMDEESDDEDQPDASNLQPAVKKNMTSSKVKCTLDDRTALMIKLIFNDDMFVSQMAHMNLDVKKMPLGKLSKTQIAKGLEALLDIEKAVNAKKSNKELANLTSVFYTLIPHDFGRKVPAVIDNQSIIDAKKELMITLSDIELTQSLQKVKSDEENVHPLDDKYQKLNCKLERVDMKSKEFLMIEKYATACQNSRKCTILDIWKVDRFPETTRFAQHSNIKHRKLLWHGTNVAVVAAIMNSGLRIMPHSGGRVGRGIYFASEHAKSSWYVGAHYGKFEKEDNVGFMLLVEVALGKEHNIIKDKYTLKEAPKGYDSVIARGVTEPDMKKDIIQKFDGNDVIVPLGQPIQTEYCNSSFSQSEYLVYKESQARIRYLLKFSFAQ